VRTTCARPDASKRRSLAPFANGFRHGRFEPHHRLQVVAVLH
jgi:hypothetical protein